MKRRFLRLFPLFILIAFLSYSMEQTWTAADFIASLLTLSRQGLPGYIGPGWSLLIEVQFYAVFPFIVLLVRKYSPLYLVGLVGLFLGIRILVWIDREHVKDLAYWTIFGRADQFLLGMLSAYLCKWIAAQRDTRNLNFAASFIIGAVGIVLFYAWFNERGGYYRQEDDAQWSFIPLVEGLFYAALVVGYVLLPRLNTEGTFNVVSKSASSSFCYLGQISYSMYLTHGLVYAAINKTPMLREIKTWEAAMVPFLFYALPAVVIVSTATYFLIEQPFRNIGRSEKKAPIEARHTNAASPAPPETAPPLP